MDLTIANVFALKDEHFSSRFATSLSTRSYTFTAAIRYPE
jgi:hypothetical protein